MVPLWYTQGGKQLGIFYAVFKLSWGNRQEVIILESLCQLKGISLHFKHWNKMRSYVKSALKRCFFLFLLWCAAFDMMRTVLPRGFTVKKNIYYYFGRTFYGENICRMKYGIALVRMMNISAWAFHKCLHIIQMSRGDLTFQMTWFCLPKCVARHSKSTEQSRYCTSEMHSGECCQTLSIFTLIKQPLWAYFCGLVCACTFSKGVTLGSEIWLAGWLENQNANEGNGKKRRQLNSAALTLKYSYRMKMNMITVQGLQWIQNQTL